MSLSASKSTSRRETSASSIKPSSSAAKQQSSEGSMKKIPLRRSKSVNAVSRSYTKATEASASDQSVEQFMNKRDNPLFCCSSPSSPEHEGGDDGCSATRGRSVSRSFSNGNLTSGNRNQWTRSLSRVSSEGRLRALSRDYFDYFERDEDSDFKENLSLRNERNGTYEPSFQKNNDATSSGHGMLEQTKNLQTWRSRHPVSDYCNTASSRSWEDGISTSSLSTLEETTTGETDHPSARGGIGCIYETVRSEVRRAVSEMKNDLENVIWKKNFMLHASDNIVDMGPELVNPDTLELISDIRMEYETKLKESRERANKLRADLAVEEQREQEISRMLKEIIPDENSTRKSRPRRKLSIERLKTSRRLAEDAMSYFDECVSISTFDSSDFSSTEDQQPSSIGIVPPVNGSRPPCTLNGRLNYHEEEIQSKCSVGAAGSSLTEISCCSSSQDVSLPLEGQKHDKLSNLVAFHGGSIEISSACEAATSGGCHDFRTYIKKFEKEPNKSAKHTEVSSSFNINDYDLENSAENLLLDIVIFKNRIESGSLLLCDIRTF